MPQAPFPELRQFKNLLLDDAFPPHPSAAGRVQQFAFP